MRDLLGELQDDDKKLQDILENARNEQDAAQGITGISKSHFSKTIMKKTILR